MKSLTYGSLFSGIGGIDLGFERAGLTCEWQVEIDDYCNRVLEKNFPDVKRYRDVKEVGKHNLKPVDVITGGFPCQPHSVAGKRKGAADDRNLWPEYLRIITELRPTWVVGENVPGIVTTYLDTVLSDLEGAGYEIATFEIPAVAFDANHIRYRIFIVAHAESERINRIGRDNSGAGYEELRAQEIRGQSNGSGEAMGNPERGRLSRQSWGRAGAELENGHQRMEEGTGIMADAETVTIRPGLCKSEPGGQRGRRFSNGSGKGDAWPAEPEVGGTINGFSSWLDRVGLNESHVLYLAYANAKKERPTEILRILRNRTETKDQQGGEAGRSGNIPEASVLLTYLRELQERETNQTWLQLAGAQASESEVRSVRAGDKPTRSPHRSGHLKQSQGEHPDTLQELSRLLAQYAEAAWLDYCGQDAETPLSNWGGDWEQGTPRVAIGVSYRVDRLRGLGNAVVPQVAEFIGRHIIAAHEVTI